MSDKQNVILLFICFLTTASWAQEPGSQKVLQQLGSFRQAFEGKNFVDDPYKTLDQESTIKLQKAYNVDAETAAIINTLKNPFISQIPTAGQPVMPQEEELFLPEEVMMGEEYEEIAKPTFKISGLVWNTDRPQAILNGTVYSKGDVIEGWTIVSIKANGIELSFQNKIFLIEP